MSCQIVLNEELEGKRFPKYYFKKKIGLEVELPKATIEEIEKQTQ